MKKVQLPNLQKVSASSLFYALSDPIRLEIVLRLLSGCEVPCGEFKVTVSKSTLSHHFKVLREAGILQKRDQGTRQYNSLRAPDLEARFPGLLKLLQEMAAPF